MQLGIYPRLKLLDFGLTQAAAIQPGDAVLVSAAAGGVGSMAGQLARVMGARHVVGLAGGAEKCAWLVNELGYHAAINYRSADLDTQLAAAFPDGIDVFFDNVGGSTLEAAIGEMADFGRISLCGGISGYNDAEPAPGPHNLMILVQRRIRMQGFIVIDYMARFEEAMTELGGWVMDGKIAWREDVQEGFDNIPATFGRLFRGENQGKQMLKLADPA